MDKAQGISAAGKSSKLEATDVMDGSSTQDNPLEATEVAPTTSVTKSSNLGNTSAANPGPQQTSAPGQSDDAELIGEFRVVKKLGQGGMGAVYKARHEALDRDVALKVLAPNLAENKSFVDRFLREARIQAKLDHPHIVKCYHIGEHKGLPYLALEYVDGGSVQACVEKLGKLSVGDSVHIALACAYALQHAHEQKMIHRDIKPDNLLISKKGVVKLADLGLAKATDENLSLTQSGTGAGTPYYMSPEQTRNAKHCDGRTDIYSMGVMLYVLLTGRMPFQGTTTVELLQSKEAGRFPPARKTVPEVPERLDLVIDKMLAKNPDHRYQTCADLIADLEGLGLANPALSFLRASTTGSGVKVMGPAAVTKSPAAQPVPTMKPKPKAKEEEAVEGIWYIKMRSEGSKTILRKMSTNQVIEAIKNEKLDNTYDASKLPKSGFRALATYPEFEPLLRGRIQQQRADRKARKYQSMYDKVMEEEATYQRRKGFRRFFNNMAGWMRLLLFLAILAGAGYAVYHFWPQIMKLVGMQ